MTKNFFTEIWKVCVMCMGYRVYIESFWSEDYASQTADSEPWPRNSNLCTIAMIMNYASTTSHKVHISFILIIRIFQKFYTSPLVCRPEDLDVHELTKTCSCLQLYGTYIWASWCQAVCSIMETWLEMIWGRLESFSNHHLLGMTYQLVLRPPHLQFEMSLNMCILF